MRFFPPGRMPGSTAGETPAATTEKAVFSGGAGQISSDGLNCGAGAQKVARPHPSLLPQEKVQKKSVVRPFLEPVEVVAGVLGNSIFGDPAKKRRSSAAVQDAPRVSMIDIISFA